MKVPEFKIATRYYFYSSRKDVFLHSRLFCCGSDGSCRKQQALALSKHLSRDKWVKRGAFRCRAAGTGPAQKRLVSPPWSRTVWPGAKEVEETIEGMLLRLEEFCSLTDMKLWAPAPPPYELPVLYRTEDHFPGATGQAALRTPGHPRRRL
ncbi:breast carcinoma-amplified sequence 4 isoform X5 [Vulpes vulpes]|uniref:Breast carcinoma-amplified sequence 4 isoform X5 n=1 Tax=Vulpes vulpes TaxID=9627 RepID=A0ABM4YN10_VULVU